MAGLAHAGYDDAARRIDAEFAGGDKVVAESVLQGVDGAGLDVEHVGGQSQQLVICQRFRQCSPPGAIRIASF